MNFKKTFFSLRSKCKTKYGKTDMNDFKNQE